MSKYLALILLIITAFTPDTTKAEVNDNDIANLETEGENNERNWVESYNRGVFEFNRQVDRFILRPIAKGYRAVTTQSVRNRVSSTLSNVREPVVAGNHLLQGSFSKTISSIGRFLINSTLGLAGMFDVAEGWGLGKEYTNFDETLANWCIPDGPFFMVPLFGPATPRALTGYGIDAAADPVFWLTYQDANVSDKIAYSYAAIKIVAARERAIEFLDDMEKNSVDFYATMRSLYIQNRQGLNNICNPSQTISYDFDFDDEDY